jgi:hypothetical protein
MEFEWIWKQYYHISMNHLIILIWLQASHINKKRKILRNIFVLVFRIKPKFSLKLLSSNEIQIDLTPASPSAFCEKSIVPQLVSNINRVN